MNKGKVIAKDTVLLILNQLCSIVSYKPVVETVIGVLFLPFYNPEWEDLAVACDVKPPGYSYKWVESSLPSTVSECMF